MDPRYFFLRPETSGLQKKFWDDNFFFASELSDIYRNDN